jgi:hypothetical protein
MYVYRNIEVRSRNHYCHEKTVKYCIIICGLSVSSVFFSSLSHKRHDFRKTVIEPKMCVLIFSTSFVRNISHYKNSARY